MNVVSVTPNPNEKDVVLGRILEVVFDKAVDPATLNTSTFLFMGPGQTSLVDADDQAKIKGKADALTGREYITGQFSYPEPTRMVFTPDRPLRPAVTYTVTLTGGNSMLATNVVKAVGGEKLAQSYTFSFTTGVLNLAVPPIVSPIPEESPEIQPDEIRVLPRRSVGNDLTQEIVVYLPDEVDLSSLDPGYSGGVADSNPFNDLGISVDALLDDPQVPIPVGLQYTAEVVGNTIRIRVTGLK